MLTDDQIAELKSLLEHREITRLSATDGEKGHLAERIISRVPALVAERDLLLSHLMEACRHIRNTDEMNVFDWGGQAVDLLTRVREKYTAQYDAQVKGPMPEKPKDREYKLLLAVAAAAETICQRWTPWEISGDRVNLKEAIAAWRAARDGVPAAGGAGKEQQ